MQGKVSGWLHLSQIPSALSRKTSARDRHIERPVGQNRCHHPISAPGSSILGAIQRRFSALNGLELRLHASRFLQAPTYSRPLVVIVTGTATTGRFRISSATLRDSPPVTKSGGRPPIGERVMTGVLIRERSRSLLSLY